MIYRAVKEIVDKIVALIGALFLVPLTPLVFVTDVLTNSSGPVFYRQIRLGKDGKPFKIIKYRTMRASGGTVDEDDISLNEYDKKIIEGQMQDADIEKRIKDFKPENDARITKVGGFLRKTSLDELPQFINVLKGDMAVIGPRPLVPGELEAYGGDSKYQSVKPGITSWWACNGRSNVGCEERLALEYYYIDHQSFRMDVRCFMKTIGAVLTRRGAR